MIVTETRETTDDQRGRPLPPQLPPAGRIKHSRDNLTRCHSLYAVVPSVPLAHLQGLRLQSFYPPEESDNDTLMLLECHIHTPATG